VSFIINHQERGLKNLKESENDTNKDIKALVTSPRQEITKKPRFLQSGSPNSENKEDSGNKI